MNIEAGGTTRFSGVIHGFFLLVVLLGLSGLVQHIPNAVLAGILISAGLGCIDRRGFAHLLKVPRSDAVVMLLVLALTVFSGLRSAPCGASAGRGDARRSRDANGTKGQAERSLLLAILLRILGPLHREQTG